MDDGTGVIDCMKWYPDNPTYPLDGKEEDDPSALHGKLVLLTGRASVWQDAGQLTIESIKLLKSPDDEVQHWRRMMDEQRYMRQVAYLTRQHFKTQLLKEQQKRHQPVVYQITSSDVEGAILQSVAAQPKTFNGLLQDKQLIAFIMSHSKSKVHLDLNQKQSK